MSESNMKATNAAVREISATRVFDAPRELVWKVWTDPNHISHWWGPKGFTNTIHKMDVKPGGRWEFIMHGPDGVDYPNMVNYLEVNPPERLVYDHGEKGELTYFRVTVSFEDLGGKTKLTMQMLFETAEQRSQVVEKYGAVKGLMQTMLKLREYLGKI
jgi:uncharacterized protein YndB with AHSA1/START domain